MSFGSLEAKEDTFIHEINMTPFVDIMLVLLIIFMITAPVLKHTVDVNLPQVSSKLQTIKPDIVILAVNQSGQYILDKTVLDESSLHVELKKIAQLKPSVVLHIYGDKQVQYDYVARAMSAAHSVGIVKVGFATRSGDK
jgi:biopolymer transport protein ExbD